MLNKKQIMIQKTRSLLPFLLLMLSFSTFAGENKAADGRNYYEIKLFRVATNEQVAQLDGFLKDDFIPALHRAGIGKTGVYHPIGNDTAIEKRVYLFIPLRSLEDLNMIEELTVTDTKLKETNTFLDAPFNASPFLRSESIVLKAFPMMPSYSVPALTGNKTERVYELRSYESATQKLYRQKVKMFNVGGEVALFKRLNFNAVFYGEVIAGSRMPNLMYMTSFNNRADRDEHWKKFGEDAEWMKLKVVPEYLNTVSRNETILLNPTEFSEL
jgi:hypothetical protein